MVSNIDLNLLLVISLVVLVFFTFCIFVVLIPVCFQLSKTLSSAQTLLDLLNEDVQPVVKEVKGSVDNVKYIARTSASNLRTTLARTNIFIISSAYGLLAAVKDYLSSYKNDKISYNGKGKQHSMGPSKELNID